MNKTLKAHLALFSAQVLYAASFPIAKIVMETIPYNILVILRVTGAVILFWLSSLMINEKVEKKDFIMLFALGMFGVAINQTLFLKGLDLTSPINAAIMMIISPILVIIIAVVIIREKITLLKSAGIIIGFAGAAYLILQNIGSNHLKNSGSSLSGDIYVFLNATSWSLFLVMVKPLMKKYHTITILSWVFLFGLPMVLPFGISDAIHFSWENLSSKIILYTLFIIVFTTFVTYLLNTIALDALSPSVVSAYIYLQPFLTALITIFIFKNDMLSWKKVIAALLIFVGVYLVSKDG
jgi:drug/metabolite transporter (DMT)-like permease